MRILMTRTFQSALKRLHPNQKSGMDDAVRGLASAPRLGEAKIGDLAGVRVYKFKMVNQLMLIAYEWDEQNHLMTLLSFGSHENFYRDIKREQG
ncbi:MAG: type II toxin-antitoxin system RelE/ParE family toxin [Magnetococcales bacterium]|nr:type II toxin-antitoxin system RelE/ParE family toxin [Magnetococcales bacterium]